MIGKAKGKGLKAVIIHRAHCHCDTSGGLRPSRLPDAGIRRVAYGHQLCIYLLACNTGAFACITHLEFFTLEPHMARPERRASIMVQGKERDASQHRTTVHAFTLQPTAYSLQPTAYSLQPTAYSLQPTAYSLQPTAYSLQL